MGLFGNLFKGDGYIPGRTQRLENADGIREDIDDELHKVFRQISRGDVCNFLCKVCDMNLKCKLAVIE